MPCFFYFSRGLLKSQFLDTGLKTSCVGGDSQESSGCQTDSEKVKVLLFWGRCSVCAALPGAVIRFINAGITRDGSSPRLLTHSVASFLSWEPLELPLSLFLSPPSASLTRLSCLFVSQTISLLFPPSLISLCLSLTVSPSISCLPFFFPDSFASSVSLLFMFASPFVTLPFSLCVQTSVAASDRSSVVASQGYVKYEMRKEVSGWQFASTSRIRHATSWKLSGRGGHTLRVLVCWRGNKPIRTQLMSAAAFNCCRATLVVIGQLNITMQCILPNLPPT